MKNANQLKANIRIIAHEKMIKPQVVLQLFMIERFLERIAESKYSTKFILKGGVLIASLLGIELRSTMDLDLTAQNFELTPEITTSIINEIIAIDIETEDGVELELTKIQEIREQASYQGLRLSFIGYIHSLIVPFKVDLTTGDQITPHPIEHTLTPLLHPNQIKLLSYNLETLLAEKLETIFSRSTESTRMRDFYDVHILAKSSYSTEHLKSAFAETVKARGSNHILKSFSEIIPAIRQSSSMQINWTKYKDNNPYAKEISFEDTVISIEAIMKIIQN